MTFHIIPWMWGVDGNKTVGISDTIYVTERGCESFFTLDEDFVVKPEYAAREHSAKTPAKLTDVSGQPVSAEPAAPQTGRKGDKRKEKIRAANESSNSDVAG